MSDCSFLLELLCEETGAGVRGQVPNGGRVGGERGILRRSRSITMGSR